MTETPAFTAKGRRKERVAARFPGEFSDEGSSPICGGGVCFYPAHPAILFTACGTRGFFRSENRRGTTIHEGNGCDRSALRINRRTLQRS